MMDDITASQKWIQSIWITLVVAVAGCITGHRPCLLHVSWWNIDQTKDSKYITNKCFLIHVFNYYVEMLFFEKSLVTWCYTNGVKSHDWQLSLTGDWSSTGIRGTLLPRLQFRDHYWLWLQMTSSAQDGSVHIQDILSYFLDSGRK